MAASDLTSMAFIYKRLYSDKQVGDLALRDHPMMKMIAKKGGFTGTDFNYAIRYGNPQGISATFATAQTNAASSKGQQLRASRFAKFGVITLQGEAIAAAEGSKGAFLDLVTQETDGVLEEMGDHLAFDLQGQGYGDRGQRASESSDVTTLVTSDTARNFKVGMVVSAGPNQDGTSLRTGTTAIISVDEDAGTIGLDTSAITSYADSDYLFVEGSEALTMEGMESLYPLTAPTVGDSWRGSNDRSVDTRRLAGVRVDDTATSPEENAGLVAVKIAQVGKKADCLFLNPIRFWEVVRRLNAKVEYNGGGGKADFAFENFMIHTPAGSLKVYSDPDVPTNRGRVLNLASNYIKHLRAFPHIIRDDQRASLRQTTADGIEARVRAWCNLIGTSPGSNGVFSI